MISAWYLCHDNKTLSQINFIKKWDLTAYVLKDCIFLVWLIFISTHLKLASNTYNKKILLISRETCTIKEEEKETYLGLKRPNKRWYL